MQREEIARERRKQEETKEAERAEKARLRKEKQQMKELADAEEVLTEAIISGNPDAIVRGQKRVGHCLFELGQQQAASEIFKQAKQSVEGERTPASSPLSPPSTPVIESAPKSPFPPSGGSAQTTPPSATQAASGKDLSRELFPLSPNRSGAEDSEKVMSRNN